MATQSSTGNGIDFNEYILALEQRLMEKQQLLNEKNQELALLSEAYECAGEEVNLLQDCCDRIEATNTLAKNVIGIIKNNQSLVVRASCNAELSGQAIQVLLANCESVATGCLQLNLIVQKLLTAVNGANCELDPDGPIMTALNELVAKVQASLDSAVEAITKSLETLQGSLLLEACMGDQNSGGGITKAMVDLLKIIDIQYDKKSKIKFPREKCPRDFYERSKDALARAKSELEKIAGEKAVCEEEQCLLDEEVTSIQNSITAAQTAGQC